MQYFYFSAVYDSIMKHTPYVEWVLFIKNKFRKTNIGQNDPILELACGTGNVLKYFNHEYQNIIGLDLSMQMLELSQNKVDNPLVLADMNRLPFRDGSFHAVYCNHDSVNYLGPEENLKKHLMEVNRILIKGGVYIFDVSTEKNVLENYRNKTINESHKRIYINWKNEYLPEEKKIISRFKFYRYRFSSLFTSMKIIGVETHMQTVYEDSFLKSLFLDLDFDLISQTADYDSKRKLEDANLMVYIISKK